MIAGLKYFYNQLLDLTFPKYCFSCREEGNWLCVNCLEKIKINQLRHCPLCKIINNGETCADCRGQSFLDGLWVFADYDEELIQKIVKAVKYKYIIELAPVFKNLAQKYFSSTADLAGSYLLPVPLHRRRFLERGFNQAEIIAVAISEFSGIPLIRPLLARTRYHQAQAKLSKEERMKNIAGSFALAGSLKDIDKDRRIILVDDVYTTGATMQECAKILKNNGYKQVWGLSVARGK